MAVAVTDTRTTIDAAESITGWTGPAATSTTVRVEGTNAVVGTLNIATGQFYFTLGASIDLSNTMVYIWSNNFAQQDVWTAANPPNAVHLGDGTDRISFKMAGSDKKVFSHLTDSDWNWDCLLLDGAVASSLDTAGRTVARAGSFGALNLAAITQVGSDFTTLSKGLGGGINVALDIMRYGNNGIRITGGTSGDTGKFSEIVALDRSVATGRAHGIIREYTTGIYGLQGPLNFGSGSGNTWFEDSNFSVTFENRDVANDKYYLAVSGASATNTTFILDNGAFSTAGPYARFDFSSPFINRLDITNCSFRNMSGSMTFGTDFSASLHTFNNNAVVRAANIAINSIDADNNTFQQCGQISVGSGSINGSAINQSLVGVDSGSVLWNVNLDTAGRLNGCSFIAGTTNHAIEFGPLAPSSMSLFDITYTGYGADSGSSAAIYNNSGKALQITLSGGDIPTIRNGTGAGHVFIQGLTTVTLTGLVNGTEVRVLNNITQAEVAGVEEVTLNEFPFTVPASLVVDIVIHNVDYEYIRINAFTIPENDTSIPIEQRFDRNYST